MTEDAVLRPPAAGESPALNFYVRNDTPYNLDIKDYNLINVDTIGVRSQEEEHQREEEMWGELRTYVAETVVPATNYPQG